MATKLATMVNKITYLARLHKHCGNSCYARRISTKSTLKPKDAEIESTQTAEEDWTSESKDTVLFYDTEDCGVITLNRPKRRNAINVPMAKAIIGKLMDWEAVKKRVILEGAGGKAYCAGGDLSLLKCAFDTDIDHKRRKFFGTLYTLFYVAGTYKLPQIVIMDPVTMGNGAGLSLHLKYRIVTERSIFAMPEASIGFYPDGGSSHVLPKLPGHLGLFLGLTCYQLKGLDIVKCGLATHCVSSEKLSDLRQELLFTKDSDIDRVIRKYQPENLPDHFTLAPYLEKIDKCFSAPSVEEIFERLQEDGSNWAQTVLKTLSHMSPTSLKVIHHVHQIAKNMTFTDCIRMEFRLSCSFIAPNSDFCKGALALTGKTAKPVWNPARLEDVRMEQILRRFEPFPPEKELNL